MSIIILHPGAYPQIGDAGQDLVEHTCASASALHVPSRLGRREVVVVVSWLCGCKPKATDLPDAPRPRPACRRSLAVPTCRHRSERAFVVNVACADWQGSMRAHEETKRERRISYHIISRRFPRCRVVSCRVATRCWLLVTPHLASNTSRISISSPVHSRILSLYTSLALHGYVQTTVCTLSTSTSTHSTSPPPHSHHLRSLESSRRSLRLMPCLVILLPIPSLEDGDRLHRICSHYPCRKPLHPGSRFSCCTRHAKPPVSHPPTHTYHLDLRRELPL
jgi:hypothetical protein